jgi:hypothetical protein
MNRTEHIMIGPLFISTLAEGIHALFKVPKRN